MAGSNMACAPIVLICDGTYELGSITAVNSLKLSKKNSTRYDIFIIYAGNNDDFNNQVKVFDEDGFRIHVIGRKYNHFSDRSEYPGPAAFLKFEIPEILEDYEKALYIDSDIVALRDLKALLDMDISGKYLAAVDETMAYYNSDHVNIRRKHGICDRKYFNSGVMLLNLARLRKDGIPAKLRNFCDDFHTKYTDQDAYNVICGRQAGYLSFYYNCMQSILHVMPFEQLKKSYPYLKETFMDKVCLYHFCHVEKPWSHNVINQDLWLKCFKKLPIGLYNTYLPFVATLGETNREGYR